VVRPHSERTTKDFDKYENRPRTVLDHLQQYYACNYIRRRPRYYSCDGTTRGPIRSRSHWRQPFRGRFGCTINTFDTSTMVMRPLHVVARSVCHASIRRYISVPTRTGSSTVVRIYWSDGEGRIGKLTRLGYPRYFGSASSYYRVITTLVL